MIPNEVLNKQNIYFNKLVNEKKEQLEILRRKKEALKYATTLFNADTSIENSIKSLKLEIANISMSFTGSNDIKITASLVSDSFKYISFKGYDSGGRGKNEVQLRNKAAKLEEKLSTSNFKAEVNQFSLEDNATTYGGFDRPNRVLVIWRLKPIA